MYTRVRQLDNSDLHSVVELLSKSPLENLFLSSRIRICGLDPFILGCQVWGFERGGRLVSICHNGANLVVVGDDDEALREFIRRMGDRRRTSAILGSSALVKKLYDGLTETYGFSWGRCREFRAHQPLLAIKSPALVAPDPRVRRMTAKDFDLYFPAAVAMYTEELGVSPLGGGSGYHEYVRSLLANGNAFGVIEDGRVIYKTDIGSNTKRFGQIQGVWTAPDRRRTGIGASALSGVVNLCLETYQAVSLYVNDYNTSARALYRKVGFSQVGELATVLY